MSVLELKIFGSEGGLNHCEAEFEVDELVFREWGVGWRVSGVWYGVEGRSSVMFIPRDVSGAGYVWV